MADRYIEPTNPRATRLHLLSGPSPGAGMIGSHRTCCGRKVHGRLLTNGDEPSLRLCSSCRRRGNP